MMNYTKLLRLRNRLVNSVRLYLKNHPSYYTDDYPNAWCDVITQEMDGRFDSWSLYELMIDGHIECALRKKPYNSHFKSLWELTDQSDEHRANNDHYEQDLFGAIMTQPIYPPDEDMIEDICIMVKRELFFSLPDLDEEMKKGWKTKKRNHSPTKQEQRM